jgi:LysM repeat protein
VKSLYSSRPFLIIILLVLALALAACERQLDPDAAGTTTPATPVLTLPAMPTTDPALVPTTDPALIPTTDPALVPTTDPAAQATAVPGTNAQATPVTTQRTHIVAAGDTLFTIAQTYGVTVEALAQANNINITDFLSEGQVLIVPAAGTTALPTAAATAQATTTAGERVHIVAAGENLFRIGLRYGFTVEELAAYNNLPNPDRIDVGQVILIPPGGLP